MRKRIGEFLVEAGLISEEQLRVALAERRRTGERLGAVLIRMELATERQISEALAEQLGFEFVALAGHPPDRSAIALIPKRVALRRSCVALSLDDNLLTVAMADPMLFSIVHDLELQTGCRIKPVVATRSDIVEAIEHGYPPDGAIRTESWSATLRHAQGRPEPSRGAKASDERFDAALVQRLIEDALRAEATDVHIEPGEQAVVIRQRVDGVLHEVATLPGSLHDPFVAHIKHMAGMDVGETRLPQDGRTRIHTEQGGDVHLRVTTLRTLFGEKAVLQLLDRRVDVPRLDEIGMSGAALETFRACLARRRGLILAAGPPGSGRTTTLAAALAAMDGEGTSRISIEDPVEYRIGGVTQTQVDEAAGLTYANALRSALQQDPDVILLGEIRDAETAALALRAAQSGNLMLSSFSGDDPASSVTGLLDLGAEPFVVASALVGVVSQRLVRRLCVHCRRPATAVEEVASVVGAGDGALSYRPVGCDQCNHTGYRGRTGIFEMMRVTDKVRRLIAARAAEERIREAALAAGMTSMAEDGVAKVKSGLTTADELLRVVPQIGEPRTLCVQCGSAIDIDFEACPHCGRRTGAPCPHCGRSLQPAWNFCPFCARSVHNSR